MVNGLLMKLEAELIQAYNIMSRIVEAMDFESNTKNWKYTFKTMTKKYGKDFIDMMKAMWQANGDAQTEQEFCQINDLSLDFFSKVVKN